MDKDSLFYLGQQLLINFSSLNNVPVPEINSVPKSQWKVDTCGYYRDGKIFICIDKCANIGTGPRQWSHPAYVVDRTPYGVLAHEMGHHIDVLNAYDKNMIGKWWSDFSTYMRTDTRDNPITSYCPNNPEWFAEIFRLFLTNPDLLKQIRPKSYVYIVEEAGLEPMFKDDYSTRLSSWGADDRFFKAARNKMK